MALSMPMIVTFEDGTQVTVEPRPKDLARAELLGHDFQTGGSIVGMYATALAALGRMSRAGTLPEGVEVPDSIEAFLDACDVEAEEGPDAAGEGSDQDHTSG